jgi:hypothetical protein
MSGRKRLRGWEKEESRGVHRVSALTVGGHRFGSPILPERRPRRAASRTSMHIGTAPDVRVDLAPLSAILRPTVALIYRFDGALE